MELHHGDTFLSQNNYSLEGEADKKLGSYFMVTAALKCHGTYQRDT